MMYATPTDIETVATYTVGRVTVTVASHDDDVWHVTDAVGHAAVTVGRNAAIDDVAEQRARVWLIDRCNSALATMDVAATVCRVGIATTVAPMLVEAANALDGVHDPRARTVAAWLTRAIDLPMVQREPTAVEAPRAPTTQHDTIEWAAKVLREVRDEAIAIDVARATAVA